MSDIVFWALIGLLNWSAAGDDEAVVTPLVSKLSQMSVGEIRAFEDTLASKLYALDTKAHAMEIGDDASVEGGFFSPDAFLYARCVVVVNGEKLYNEVLADPTKFPKDMEFESILYVAAEAFSLKTGEDFDHAAELSYETYSNEKGWK